MSKANEILKAAARPVRVTVTREGGRVTSVVAYAGGTWGKSPSPTFRTLKACREWLDSGAAWPHEEGARALDE